MNSSLSSSEFAAAGALSGFVTRFCCQPLDVIKILFQLQVGPKSSSKYTSIIQTVRLVAKEEGVAALWKGHVPAQWLSVVFGAVQFSAYEKIIRYSATLRAYNNTVFSDTAIHFYAGSASGIAAVSLSFPFDTIRTRLVAQTKSKQYKGLFDAARKIWIHEGVRGYFQGLSPACIGITSSSGLIFGFKNIYTQIWNACTLNDTECFQLSAKGHWITGMLAGLTSKIILYPLDLVKKRLQIQGMDKGSICLNTKSFYQGVINCIQSILKCEGFLGMYKGILPSMIKSGLVNAINFTVYYEICRLLSYAKR